MSDATIIEVSFTDAETGQEFLKLKLPVRGLPQRDATWTLGQDDWLVVDSTPERIEETMKVRKLSLVLRKVQYVDAKAIRFSLPTVADLIPEEETEGGSMENALRLHEDDWLQLELVPKEVVPQAAADLEAVKAVLSNEREGAGFKRLHIRKALPAPFAAHSFSMATLRGYFGAERPVAYKGHPSPLKNCFALILASGAWIYGHAAAGQVVSLGLTTRDEHALNRLEALALIDWCAGKVG